MKRENVEDKTKAVLNQDDRKELLKWHNSHRANVNPTATNMAFLVSLYHSLASLLKLFRFHSSLFATMSTVMTVMICIVNMILIVYTSCFGPTSPTYFTSNNST